MTKSTLQSNLENFICMLSQDYDKIDQDLPISTIHKLLITIDRSFFEHVNVINWLDVQSLIQQFYHNKNLTLNAMEDIRANEIESGDQKSLVETLIILCSLVKLFNEEHYEEVRDYFQNKVPISEDHDFFIFVDDVYNEIRYLIETTQANNNKSNNAMQKKKENEETQHLLNLISNKNEIIQDLQKDNKELTTDIVKFKSKIKELNSFLEKNQYQQDESTKNLQMQESIFENKLKLMEEDLSKVKEEYEKRIKKMITNHDLEKEKVKAMIHNWNEEKAIMQKEIKKNKNEKKIADKNVNLKMMDINELKKENKVLANKVKSLEIKIKSSINWKSRCEKLKTENKKINTMLDELEAKMIGMERNNISDKNVYGINLNRSSKHRLNLDTIAQSITSNANNDIYDEPEEKNFRMRESEVNLDEYNDMTTSLTQHITENAQYFGPRDTIPAMNVSPITQMNLQEYADYKIDEQITGISEKDQEPVETKIPEDHISFEDVGILYSAFSEYLVNHLDMKDYYTSRKTRERDIMRPFVIDQFFK